MKRVASSSPDAGMPRKRATPPKSSPAAKSSAVSTPFGKRAKVLSPGKQALVAIPKGHSQSNGSAESNAIVPSSAMLVLAEKCKYSKETQLALKNVKIPLKDRLKYDMVYAPYAVSLQEQVRFVADYAAKLRQKDGDKRRYALSGNILGAVKLFREQYTFEFIARYRKVQTKDMTEEDLKIVQKALERCDQVEKRRETALVSLDKKKESHNIGDHVFLAILDAASTEDIEDLLVPYKEKQPDKAARARQLGFLPLAEAILVDEDRKIKNEIWKLEQELKKHEVYLAGKESIEEMAIALAANLMYETKADFPNETALRRSVKYTTCEFPIPKKDIENGTAQVDRGLQQKYRNYMNFQRTPCDVLGYQYFAIERAAEAKVVKTSFEWSESGQRWLNNIVYNNRYFEEKDRPKGDLLALTNGDDEAADGEETSSKRRGSEDCTTSKSTAETRSSTPRDFNSIPQFPYRADWIQSPLTQKAMKKASDRLKGKKQRDYTKDMKYRAVQECLERFKSNLAAKLLTQPMRLWSSTINSSTNNILALDPGFTNGTKCAIISSVTGDVIDATTLYFKFGDHGQEDPVVQTFIQLLNRYTPMIVALGNGHGSSNIEKIVKQVILDQYAPNTGREKLAPILQLVDETGASVYSATELAAAELPDLDNLHRSAVSLARRVLDPLAEFVKIPPGSLGVGQYQHSLNTNDLTKAAEECFMSCIAKIGVDLKTCSAELLRYVPGVKAKQAEAIITHRKDMQLKKDKSKTSSGNANQTCFSKKDDVKKVKGVGPKTYEEMSGFIYISDAESYLDRCPHIHPDHYYYVKKLEDAFGGQDLPLIRDANDLNERNSLSVSNSPTHRSNVYSSDYDNNRGEKVITDVRQKLNEILKNEFPDLVNVASTDRCKPMINLSTLKQICLELIPFERGGKRGRDLRSDEPLPPYMDYAQIVKNEKGREKIISIVESLLESENCTANVFTNGNDWSNNWNDWGRSDWHSSRNSGSEKLGLINTLIGRTMTGVVRNVVDFGAFIDCGLQNDVFAHISNMPMLTQGDVQVNQQVNCEILKVEIQAGKGKGKGGKKGKPEVKIAVRML